MRVNLWDPSGLCPGMVTAAAGEGWLVAAPQASSFESVFAAEYAATVRTAYLLLGDRDAAVDVAQEAFVRLHLQWRKVAGYDRPGAWVRRVAIRIAARQARRRIARDDVERRYSPMSQVEADPALRLDVRDAVLSLPAAQRAAVVLHYLEDLPVREVASLLRCSEATAKVHLHRGRRRLGTLLGEEDR